MLFSINPESSTPQTSSCTAAYLPSYKPWTKKYQRSKDKFISNFLLWTPTYGCDSKDLCTSTLCRHWRPSRGSARGEGEIARERERERERKVLETWWLLLLTLYFFTFFLLSSILKTLIKKSITLLRVLCDEYRLLTFFAPTDEAFQKLPADVKNKLKNDVPLLTKVCIYIFVLITCMVVVILLSTRLSE